MDGDDSEIKTFLKVWILAIASLTYCYLISSKIPKGLPRLVFFLPIITLFTLFPLNLTTFHLTTITFFFLGWLANSKLLLLAFDQGPLASQTNLLHFILLASLPIKTKTSPPHEKSKNNTSPTKKSLLELPTAINFVLKVVLLLLLFQLYDHRDQINHYLVLFIYGWYLYLELEIILTLVATPAHFMGFELDPQFNEPYLTTSLQDFWGCRWNLMVTNVLRSTVYYPTRNIVLPIVGKDGAQLLGVITTFTVSGLVHELLYYYLTRAPPTWEVTWYFVVHGVAVVLEMVIKRVVRDRWRLHRMVSGALTIGFVSVTAFWLFFPQILRNKSEEKALGELASIVDSIKGAVKLK